MNKIDYLKQLNLLNLDKNKYCIYGGGVMLMHGLKAETNDLDLLIDSNYLPELLIKFGSRIVKIRQDKYVLDNTIDFVTDIFNIDQIDIIEGYPVCSLLVYRERLLLFNREKDIGKVAIIDEYMEHKKNRGSK